ncbi:YciI family protein [Streptomyces sp.]|uniref:YciI family protein n=1 Tax=Streptomyces sp. TaxID=1931 RepID=UPI002D78EA86|nr:YciI family protein [Streptomyces sp.]HET6358026.1 YciI family protein [Streptomyces sp.]
MSLFAVTREAGPSWIDGKGAFEQPAVNDHAAYMNSLADEGFVLFAGPLSGSEHDRIRVLLIAEAASEADIRRRLADDPWARTQRVVTTSVEPWNLLVGAEHLGAQPAAQ